MFKFIYIPVGFDLRILIHLSLSNYITLIYNSVCALVSFKMSDYVLFNFCRKHLPKRNTFSIDSVPDLKWP